MRRPLLRTRAARRGLAVALLAGAATPASAQQVGRLEGIVTDATAGRIRDLIIASLQGESYGPALLAGVEALVGLIARGMGVSDSALTNARPLPPAAGPSSPFGGMLPLLLLLFF